MITGRLSEPLDAATDLPWSKDFRLWSGRTKASPAEIVSASGKLRLRGCEAPDTRALTQSGGEIVLSNNVIGVRLAAGIAPGVYDLEVTAFLTSGGARRIQAVLNVASAL